ncbi:hypothetical protein Agub_g4721 [Astrephomene gubernaculifera]|uniref:Ubiquitin-like domain-containing protein n=1 Tax=Astrephomene gubernaculifera TaxID=47775 RepID=A0AAD3DMS0_9CHLO|nr:hypothetical protein Agub_g4721 [Astrephomene gubernaculifera]
MTTSNYRVKFVSHADEPDIIVVADETDTIDVIIQQVCKARQVPPHRHLRILCAGRELYADDPVSKARAKVLHCTVTDSPPQRPPPAPPRKVAAPAAPPPPPVVEQPPVDWLDVVDPGTVLMWIFGSILALLWLLFVFYAAPHPTRAPGGDVRRAVRPGNGALHGGWRAPGGRVAAADVRGRHTAAAACEGAAGQLMMGGAWMGRGWCIGATPA